MRDLANAYRAAHQKGDLKKHIPDPKPKHDPDRPYVTERWWRTA